MSLSNAVSDSIAERAEVSTRTVSDRTPLAEPKGTQPEKSGRDEPPTGSRRAGRKRSASKISKTTPVARYFLTKSTSNGLPELDRELGDENEAMIEALKLDRTFAILTEWRPKVDSSVKGRPVVEKEQVSRSAQ